MTDESQIASAVGSLRIADYDYPLPDARIALHPEEERDRCRLLVCDGDGVLSDRRFDELPVLLEPGTLMVCNNTRVINARLHFRKPTGSLIEVFLLEPEQPSDYALMFQSRGECVWKCIIGNLKRWKSGELSRVLTLDDGREVTLSVERVGGDAKGGHSVALRWDDPSLTLAEILDSAGRIPIPPYLNRESEDCDSDDYQTVYSKIKGSVAAPTAGLHFTDRILEALDAGGVRRAELTLHVGAGTFMPVKSDTIGEHPMHTEVYSIRREVLGEIIAEVRQGRRVTAVGTTSVRTLESLPLTGRRLSMGLDPHVTQWEAYDDAVAAFDTLEGLQGLADYMDSHGMSVFTSSTAIMIAPGFRWRLVGRMVTNFHQPESTLLLLVSSFLGLDADGRERWRRMYDHALAGDYRFLSYGDACLLTKND